MGEVQWIKLYIDMFDKRKINKIRRLPDGDRILLFWVMLLATAGKCNAGGMIFITERVPFTEDDLADEFDFDINTIRLALKVFEELDMITTTPEGFINVIGWEEHQNIDRLAEIREYNRIAKQRSRARHKELQNVNDKSMTSQCGHDTEEEGDKEEESLSFNHSRASEELNTPERRRRYLGGIGKNVVFLSDEQMSDLLDKLSIEEFDKYVGIVAENELKGHHYKKKTHYQAILKMAMNDRKIQ